MALDGSVRVASPADKPPRGTRTRSRTASGSRAGPGRASTAPSEAGRAGRRPGRPGPPSAGATTFLEGGRKRRQEVVRAIGLPPPPTPAP